MANRRAGPADGQRAARGGIVLGVGLAATLDEAIFHQLLDWHHFLDRSDPGGTLTETARTVGLAADGAFHLFGTALIALGLAAMLYRGGGALQRHRRRALGAILAGAGGFNLYDGIVQHKLLGLHQIRRGVENLLPYDVAWMAVALALLVVGLQALRQSQGPRARPG